MVKYFWMIHFFWIKSFSHEITSEKNETFDVICTLNDADYGLYVSGSSSFNEPWVWIFDEKEQIDEPLGKDPKTNESIWIKKDYR